jgi:large subunit ribosomal protein L29
MKTDKVRNCTDEELRNQEHELNDQLFKLKFQLNMGQTESLKKIRGMRKDIARVKTIAREREMSATGTDGSVTTIAAPKVVATRTSAKTVTTKAKAKRKTEKK